MKTFLLTESEIHAIIANAYKHCLTEAYGKWFQTEENNAEQIANMINIIQPQLDNLEELSPQEVWEVIRQVAYINHSAFKVRPGMRDKYPHEMLTDEDFNLNQLVYTFKDEAVSKLIDYYIEHGYDISADENRKMVAFREPLNGIRQITFHLNPDSELGQRPERNDATWDGVKQAHHYTDDESYNQMRLNR